MVNMPKVNLKIADDIEAGTVQLNGGWYATISVPWHRRPRVVCNANKPIIHANHKDAVLTAHKAVIGQWQDKTTGTKNGINSRSSEEIEKMFGKNKKKGKANGRRNKN